MLEVPRIQAVSLEPKAREPGRVERGIAGKETKIQLTKVPGEITSFFEFVPLGFQLEAYVKKATREEVKLLLNFLGRDVEITVKNPLGLQFQPGQKVLLTLIDRNPYVLKVSLPIAESYKIFSLVRNYFQSPIPSILSKFLTSGGGIWNLLLNSGIFYENRVIKYLLGKENRENLKGDLKFKLFSLIKGLGFDRSKYKLLARPLGFSKLHPSLPFIKIDLNRFVRIYAPFYELKPKLIETLAGFVVLTKQKLKRKFNFPKRRAKIKEFDKPLFFSKLNRKVYQSFIEKTLPYNLLKDTVNFIQYLQGWIIAQNYRKMVVPINYQGKKLFLGFYKTGNKRNLSLLWENGLIKLTFPPGDTWNADLLIVTKNEPLLYKLKRHVNELIKDLQDSYINLRSVNYGVAQNVEELFILDMADKEHSNFIKIYL
jgi:hypothetical protein